MLKICNLSESRCSGKNVKNILALILYILVQSWAKFHTEFARLMPSCKSEFNEKLFSERHRPTLRNGSMSLYPHRLHL